MGPESRTDLCPRSEMFWYVFGSEMTSGPFASRPPPVSGANMGAARLRGGGRRSSLSGVAPGEQNRCGGRGRCRTAISAPNAAACLPRGRRGVRLHRNQTCNPQSTLQIDAAADEMLCVLSVPIAGVRRGATGGPFALHLHTLVCHTSAAAITRIQILLQCQLGYEFSRAMSQKKNSRLVEDIFFHLLVEIF